MPLDLPVFVSQVQLLEQPLLHLSFSVPPYDVLLLLLFLLLAVPSHQRLL